MNLVRRTSYRGGGLSTLLLAVLGLGPPLMFTACGEDGPGAPRDAGGEDAGSASDAASVDPGADAALDGGVIESTAIANYCKETASAYFSWLQHCYGAQGYPDSKRSEQVARLEMSCLYAERAVADERLRYDGMQATRCLATIDTSSCVGEFLDDEACRGLFAGLVPPGGDCYPMEGRIFMVGSETCSAGFCEVAGTCPGSCVPFAAREESCEGTRCGPEDYCDPAERRCRARKQSGERCGDDAGDCLSDLICRDGTERICVAVARNEGDPCGAETVCGGPSVCVEGRCRSRSELGKPCTLPTHCPVGAVCARDPEAGERVCLTPRGEGGSCTEGGAQCQAPLICAMVSEEGIGVCSVDPSPGLDAPCDDGICAAGYWCKHEAVGDQGVCKAMGEQGEPCFNLGVPDYTACRDGLYCTEAETCEPPGELGDPCSLFDAFSCVAGLWCSRETGQCVRPGGEDSACNPAWQTSCGEGLGCACGLLDREACGSISRAPSATDRCQPKVADDGDCYRSDECESLNCQFDHELPSSTPGKCIPEAQLCLPA